MVATSQQWWIIENAGGASTKIEDELEISDEVTMVDE